MDTEDSASGRFLAWLVRLWLYLQVQIRPDKFGLIVFILSSFRTWYLAGWISRRHSHYLVISQCIYGMSRSGLWSFHARMSMNFPDIYSWHWALGCIYICHLLKVYLSKPMSTFLPLSPSFRPSISSFVCWKRRTSFSMLFWYCNIYRFPSAADLVFSCLSYCLCLVNLVYMANWFSLYCGRSHCEGCILQLGRLSFFSVRASSSGLICCSDLGIISIEQTTENAFAYAKYWRV